MDITNPRDEKGNPEKAYRDELENKGSVFGGTPAESDARDRAKIEKARAGITQKIDGIDPEDIHDEYLADEIRRETLEKK